MSTASTATTTTVRWLTAEQQRHWRAYVDGVALLTDALARDLERDAGLSLSEYEILVRLSEAPDRTLRMSSLAEELAHSRSRITHTIRRMEDRGFVERRACEGDGRGVNALMTDLGMARLESAAPLHVTSVRAGMIDVLTAKQLRALGEAMAVVYAALRASSPGSTIGSALGAPVASTV